MKRSTINGDAIILYDGDCVLCSRSVRFVIKKDPVKYFRFAPLKSDAAQELLKSYGKPVDQFSSVVLIEQGRVLDKSTAALSIAGRLKKPWSLTKVLLILPLNLRDWIYDWIARNRYRWLGKSDKCRIPEKEAKIRFL
jgi:predicted DCC family thiol-disulfide oxidoreductase YuxK